MTDTLTAWRATILRRVKNACTIFLSGYVRRYASNAHLAHVGDTDAHHQAQVAQLMFSLFENPSRNLIYEALHHDCGELDCGDISALAKREDPKLARRIRKREKKRRAAMGCPVRKLNKRDKARLKLGDGLQAYLHTRHVAPHVIGTQDWQDARAHILSLAWQTGVGAEVQGMIADPPKIATDGGNAKQAV